MANVHVKMGSMWQGQRWWDTFCGQFVASLMEEICNVKGSACFEHFETVHIAESGKRMKDQMVECGQGLQARLHGVCRHLLADER